MGNLCSKSSRRNKGHSAEIEQEQNAFLESSSQYKEERNSNNEERNSINEERNSIKEERNSKKENEEREEGGRKGEREAMGGDRGERENGERAEEPERQREDNTSHTQRECRTNLSEVTEVEEAEAENVDCQRDNLIQKVTLVMPMVDKLYQKGMIHPEACSNIGSCKTSMEQMRELYKSLNSGGVKVKSAFYRIVQEHGPNIVPLKDVIQKHKDFLSSRCKSLKDSIGDETPLDEIYTELHVIKGESEWVQDEHELWQIEDKSRRQKPEGTTIDSSAIFTSIPHPSEEKDSSQAKDKSHDRQIKTVMTKGIAGIGKSVLVQKFILDWANGKSNQHIDFIFELPFRQLNLVKDQQFSLLGLVKDFYSHLSNIDADVLANCKVLFIFDGLDESQLRLEFKSNRSSSVTKESPVNMLITNLIQDNLLPKALLWITSRPGAAGRIPRHLICQWTEVRGFNDPEKKKYFEKKIDNKQVSDRIIEHIASSRSFYIMCHIPIFCWIASRVLVHVLSNAVGKTDSAAIPTTLTEMFTHFLLIQTKVADEKYHNKQENDADIQKFLKASKDFILQLGRMAFDHLAKGSVMFYEKDLMEYGIDLPSAGVYCGWCTEIIKEESGLYRKKIFCFVHLTVQEYFAALFVYHCFASKTVNSPSLRSFLLDGSDKCLECLLDKQPVDIPLHELMEITMANSTLRKNGELDMFLRFLVGLSLESTQKLLLSVIQQTDDYSETVEEIKTSLKELDLGDVSAERCLNIIHCLIEVKDNSLHETIQEHLKPGHRAQTELSPGLCSALADSILMLTRARDEFDLKRVKPSHKGIFRLIPAVRNCRKVIISGVSIDRWNGQSVASALKLPHSPLRELHLTENVFSDVGVRSLYEGLMSPYCKLEALSLCGYGISSDVCESLVSTLTSGRFQLRELYVGGGLLRSSFENGLPAILEKHKLEKIRLNRNEPTGQICKVLVSAFGSSISHLRELDLSYNYLKDSEVMLIAAGLISQQCRLETLRLCHNYLGDESCEALAAALSSNPSHLRELDLSHNDLEVSGVKLLCNGKPTENTGLTSPHCRLEILRLSFCKVTEEGCVILASALKSFSAHLKELDLSYNYPGSQGVTVLNEILLDPKSTLEKLNVEANEECWVKLELLRKLSCDLTLDPNTLHQNIILSEEAWRMEGTNEDQLYPEHPDRFIDVMQVMSNEGLTGCHYWEVELERSRLFCNAELGVAYKGIRREDDCSAECAIGMNDKSWSIHCSSTYRFHHNNSCICFSERPREFTVVGVYLNWPAGVLSFFDASSDTPTHLYTFHTTFTEPVYPAFSLSTHTVIVIRRLE